MNYVGIDHHFQYSHVTVTDPRGRVLRSGRVPDLQSEVGRFLATSGAKQGLPNLAQCRVTEPKR